MKAIILGAGRIGRGFVSQILHLNDIELVFFDNSSEMVELMNEKKEYTVHVMGYPEENTTISNVHAYLVSDTDQLEKEWEDADFLITAVGGKNLPALGKYIGAAFKKLCMRHKVHYSNIITCENWVDPAKDIKDAILETLTAEEKEEFSKMIGVAEAVILTTGAGSPDGKIPLNPVDTWVQNFKYLPLEKETLKGEYRELKYVEYVENFGNLLKQKLYTNNTSVGLVAYLGYLKGLTYVSEAANDPEIAPMLDEVYKEINEALIEGLGINEESQYAFSKRAKAKYQDRNIVDLLTRIARDPLRKLAPDDRLIGPAHISLSIHKQPKAIALATAAALYYDNPDDESAVRLSRMREEIGVDGILKKISRLEDGDPLFGLIHESIDILEKKGWIKEK